MTSEAPRGTARALNPSSPPHERAPSPSEELVAALAEWPRQPAAAVNWLVAQALMHKAADLIATQQREIEVWKGTAHAEAERGNELEAERNDLRARVDQHADRIVGLAEKLGLERARAEEAEAQLSAATARAEGAEGFASIIAEFCKTTGMDTTAILLRELVQSSDIGSRSLAAYHKWGEDIRRADEAEAARDALKAELAKAREWSPNDKDDEWTPAIMAAHPTRGTDPKRWNHYDTALAMVGNRRSKYALVDLVNWLLSLTPEKDGGHGK